MKPIISTVFEKKIYEDYDRILKQWNLSYEETVVRNEFGETFIIITGNDKAIPLIMLHDAAANSAVMWSENIKALSEKYRCILVDMLGSPGKSIPGKSFYRNFNQHVWLDTILMELNVEKCYGLGIGMGADVLLDYMLYNPDLKKTICIEGGIKLHKYNTVIPTMRVERMISTSQALLKKVCKALKVSKNYQQQNAEKLQALLLLVKAYNSSAMKYHKSQDYHSIEIKQLKHKLFIFGENGIDDNLKIINHIIQEKYPYILIEDAGHLVNMEKAESVNTYIMNYLDTM
jgi:pimeloyl-ACP methyl ester carboxylesterase